MRSAPASKILPSFRLRIIRYLTMTTYLNLSLLSNPLITSKQLLDFRQQHGSREEADSLLFALALLTQSAGILLRLPQEVIATSIVVLQRYLVCNTSDTKFQCDVKVASAASIYVCAKQGFYPLSPRSIVNVYAYLRSQKSLLWSSTPSEVAKDTDAKVYFVSEGTYEHERLKLFRTETQILAVTGFETKVTLPYSLALTYLQALGAHQGTIAQRAFEHLNAALLSPQLLYLTHQPNELAVAAIYLAAREIGIKLVNENWWEVFDVDRESLGFLVLAYGSFAEFAVVEVEKWKTRPHPLLE